MDELHCGRETLEGTYKIVAIYSNRAQTIQFSLNRQTFADCKLPVDAVQNFPLKGYPDWMVWHIWNKADGGEINFPQTGRRLLTLRYRKGNNPAYFDFVPEN